MSDNNFPNLDSKQMDLLNRKMQNFDEDNPIGTVGRNASVGPILPNEMTQRPPADVILSPNIPSQEERIDDMKQKIMDLERELDDAPQHDLPSGEMTFKDSSGNETFYVKNVSGKHVVITDIRGSSDDRASSMEKIPKGKAVDLLRLASLDDIKRSRDLRNALYGSGSDKMLVRLTEKEYFNEKTQEKSQKKRIDMMRQQEELNRMQNPVNNTRELLPHEKSFGPTVGNEQNVRPLVLSKIGKLALRRDKDPEVSRQAMTSPEFVSWIQGENLTHYEIEYIMGDPNVVRDHDIRAALLEKRKSIPQSE